MELVGGWWRHDYSAELCSRLSVPQKGFKPLQSLASGVLRKPQVVVVEQWLGDGNLHPALCGLQLESVMSSAFWWVLYLFRLVQLASSWLYVKWRMLLSQTLAQHVKNTSCSNSR